jgi:hypothetical protein
MFGDSAGHGRRADGARAMLVEFISDQANHPDEKRQQVVDGPKHHERRQQLR